MINKLTSKLKNEKQTNVIKYDFKHKCTGIAGFCPDCGGFVSFNSYHQRYECLVSDCCFEADINCVRIWDNSMREKNIQAYKDKVNNSSL